MDSGSTGDVIPDTELSDVEAVQCIGDHAGRRMFAASGTNIGSGGAKKFKPFTDLGFPMDCALISGAVKKTLTAITCDEGGEECQWVIHAKTGGWIVNCKTRKKIPFKRQGNTYHLDAWVQIPDTKRSRESNSMDVDQVKAQQTGSTRPSHP